MLLSGPAEPQQGTCPNPKKFPLVVVSGGTALMKLSRECVCVCGRVFVADYKRGFGGRYGLQRNQQDQCALGYEHKESLAKHESQTGTDSAPLTLTHPHTYTHSRRLRCSSSIASHNTSYSEPFYLEPNKYYFNIVQAKLHVHCTLAIPDICNLILTSKSKSNIIFFLNCNFAKALVPFFKDSCLSHIATLPGKQKCYSFKLFIIYKSYLGYGKVWQIRLLCLPLYHICMYIYIHVYL